MKERWKVIDGFDEYAVSNHGRVQSLLNKKILALNQTQSGLVQVGLMLDRVQKHRSVPLLVAKAFIPQHTGPFDTPINVDGDRYNNHVNNLAWRPRWFAIRYHQQFKQPYSDSINASLMDLKTGEILGSSLECAKRYGLLERDIVLSVLNNTQVWPTHQEFKVVE